MIKYHIPLLIPLPYVTFILIHPSCASKNNVTKLVDEECVKTSNYSFCIESLYSYNHTPDTDEYALALNILLIIMRSWL
ncbi:putative pectinesterase inhibitor domain-containing protein [Lupinus albus]|uniref:Putative pectinesterase inhibitor domain-containing protein n=1 Tax=Lupinus albus TaxID=3870 RepID=A0A6A4P054_LUPAL|nr:putative pectinesterase inhibitor domain-containing protein [Lupinus albus]